MNEKNKLLIIKEIHLLPSLNHLYTTVKKRGYYIPVRYSNNIKADTVNEDSNTL